MAHTISPSVVCLWHQHTLHILSDSAGLHKQRKINQYLGQTIIEPMRMHKHLDLFGNLSCNEPKKSISNRSFTKLGVAHSLCMGK